MTWHHRRRERLDGLEPLLSFANGASVLDIGCHRGFVCYEFARHGATQLHGVDYDGEGIQFARQLFIDVGCENRFDCVDLAKYDIPSPTFPISQGRYDIVLLIGVYHKLARQMDDQHLNRFITTLATRTRSLFAWNGFASEFAMINRDMQAQKMQLVHRSSLLAETAIWKRVE